MKILYLIKCILCGLMLVVVGVLVMLLIGVQVQLIDMLVKIKQLGVILVGYCELLILFLYQVDVNIIIGYL